MGSLKIDKEGVLNVNIMNEKAIISNKKTENFEPIQKVELSFNFFVSYIYVIPAEMKNIIMLTQSGDFPIIPL